MDISIVILVYNEKENLKSLYQSLRDTLSNINRTSELIFIDDGSSDGSFAELKNLTSNDDRTRLIRLDKNYGMATGLQIGFQKARGDIIVTIDADLQNDPQDVVRLLENMANYDLLCGVREKRQEHPLKTISSKLGNFFRNLVLGENFKDVGCGLRAIRRKCLDKIKLYKNFEVFLPSLFLIEGFKVGELIVSHQKRRYGKSKFNLKNRIIKYFLALLVVRWFKKNKITYNILEEC